MKNEGKNEEIAKDGRIGVKDGAEVGEWGRKRTGVVDKGGRRGKRGRERRA